MFNHLFLKFILVFLVGAIFMLFFVQYLPGYTGRRVLGGNTNNMTLDEQLQKVSGDKVSELTQKMLHKVLPRIFESPAFEPLLETTKDIKDTTQEVRSLPQEQKKAICREICSDR